MVQDRQITLKEAAGILGVKEGTIRYWANRGRLLTNRTPGGHRRFYLSEIRALSQRPQSLSASEPHKLEEEALTKVQLQMPVSELVQEEWFLRMPVEVRTRFRLLGRHLLVLFVRWTLAIGDTGSIEEEARMVGFHHGTEMARGGSPLADSLAALVFFRNAVLDSLSYDTWRKIIEINDQVMVGIVKAHEEFEG